MVARARKILRKHIEPRFYAGLWLCAVLLLGTIVFLFIRGYTANKDAIATLGTILSVVIATIGWIWNGRVQLDMAKRTNALQLLSRIAEPSVSDIKKVVYPYIIEYHKFINDEIKKKPKTPKNEIEKLLGLYEQISVAVLCGSVNEEMIKYSQDLIFERIYIGLKHHIDKVQQIDKNYFICFEGLACRWHAELEKHAAPAHRAGSLFDPLGDT